MLPVYRMRLFWAISPSKNSKAIFPPLASWTSGPYIVRDQQKLIKTGIFRCNQTGGKKNRHHLRNWLSPAVLTHRAEQQDRIVMVFFSLCVSLQEQNHWRCMHVEAVTDQTRSWWPRKKGERENFASLFAPTELRKGLEVPQLTFAGTFDKCIELFMFYETAKRKMKGLGMRGKN